MKIPSSIPDPGFYYHYKHNPACHSRDYAYEMLGVGFHTEEDCRPGEEWFVLYRPLYEHAPVYQAHIKTGIPCCDARPGEMWVGHVTKDGVTFPRFSKIIDADVIAELKKIRSAMYGSA